MQGYIQIMVGRAGASKDAPVSVEAGYANPVRFTTSQIGVCGGDCPNHSTGAVVMTTIPTLAQPEITVINGPAVTSSLAIADYFAKRHDDVLKKIRTLECSPEFRARNFCGDINFSQSAKRRYTQSSLATKLPVMVSRFWLWASQAKRAARFKEAYITAFNQMEQALIGKVDTSCVAHNAHVVYLYMAEIHRVWLEQLYPMLVSVQSPLASSLYDYINDGVFVAGLVDSELNEKHREVRK